MDAMFEKSAAVSGLTDCLVLKLLKDSLHLCKTSLVSFF